MCNPDKIYIFCPHCEENIIADFDFDFICLNCGFDLNGFPFMISNIPNIDLNEND